MPDSLQQTEDADAKLARYLWILIIGAALGFLISTRVLSPPEPAPEAAIEAFEIPDEFFSDQPIREAEKFVSPPVELQAPEPPFVSISESVGLGAAFGALIGFLLFLLAIIRPIPLGGADSGETRRVILSTLPLPLISGFCGGGIGLVQWLWSAAFGSSPGSEFSPYIGVASGMSTAFVFLIIVEKFLRSRDKSRNR